MISLPLSLRRAALLLLALGCIAALAWAVMLVINDGRRDAVALDRAETSNRVNRAARAADRQAAREKAALDLTDMAARSEQMEAINASMATPDGDPLCAVVNCVRPEGHRPAR